MDSTRALGLGRGGGTWGNRNLRPLAHDQRPGTANPLPSLDQLPLLHMDNRLRVHQDLLQQLPPRVGKRDFMSSNGPPVTATPLPCLLYTHQAHFPLRIKIWR